MTQSISMYLPVLQPQQLPAIPCSKIAINPQYGNEIRVYITENAPVENQGNYTTLNKFLNEYPSPADNNIWIQSMTNFGSVTITYYE